MSNPSTPTSQNKVRGPTVRVLARILTTLGRRWFARTDREAGWHGWKVTQRSGGFGRRYRDPRFGSLSQCPLCDGDGIRAGQVCGPCAGTGRVSWAAVSSVADLDREGQDR